MIVDELIAILGFKVQGEAEAKRFKATIASMDKGLMNFAARATSAGAMFRTAMTGIAATFTGGIIANFGNSVIRTAGQFEAFEAQLETLFKDAVDPIKETQSALKWIEKFEAETPYGIEEVTEAFIRLKNRGLDPTNGTLAILGDTAAAKGKTLTQTIEAIADAMQKNNERLKEFDISAAVAGDNVTYSWTENQKTVTKTVKATSEEMSKFLLEFWQQRFGGGMLRLSKTWGGMLSSLGSQAELFKKRIATSGGDNSLFQNVKNRLADLLDWIDEMDASGKLNEWAGNIGKAYNTAFNAMLRQAKHVQTLSKYWDNVKGALSTVGGGFLLLAARAHPLIAAITGLGLVLEDYLVYKEGGRSVIGRVIDAITDKGKAITKEEIAKRIGELIITIPIKYIFGEPKPDKEKHTEGLWKRITKSVEKDLEDIDKTGKELGKFLTGKPSEDSFLKTIQGFLQGIDTGIDKGGGKKFNDWFRNSIKSMDEWFANLSKINEKSGKALLSIFAFTKDTQKTFEDMQKFIESIDWQGTGAKIINGIWSGMMAPFSGLKKWWEGSFNSLPNVPSSYSNMPGTSGGTQGSRSNYPASVEPELPMWEDPDTKAMDNLFRNIDKQKRTNEDPYEGARTYYDHQTINRAAPTVQINQTITKATDAPQRAAEATGKAVSNVFSTQSPSRLELEPALP